MTATIPPTMFAWSQRRYGGPEGVALTRVDIPRPGKGEVLIQVAATALNSADIRIMRGDPLLVRLAFGLRRPRITVQGRDVAGTVVARGPGVDAFAVGDEVVGEVPGGGLAPFVLARADALVLRPEEVATQSAATLPLAGGTAWQALDLAHVGEGSRVLVVGAGGGVGMFAVSLASLRGASVAALAGQSAMTILPGLGAQCVLDYRRHTPRTATKAVAEASGGVSFDAIIDIAGSLPLRALQQITADGGTIVLVAGGTNRVFGPLGRMLRAIVLSIGSRRRIRPLAAVATPAITRELLALAAEGRLAPHIERVWPFAEAPAGLAHLDSGHAVGKSIVDNG